MVGCFLFHRRNGLHVSLFIARSGEAFMRHPDRWRDWGCAGHSARVSATRPASCPVTPAVVVVDRVRGGVVARPGADCPEGSPAAARSVVPVSPAVSPAVRSASRLLVFNSRRDNGEAGVKFPHGSPMEPASFLFDAFS